MAMALTAANTRAAILYNRRRAFDPRLILRVQRSVGVEDEGVLGPLTVAALAKWQAGRGLAADGKLGPRTLAALEREWASEGGLLGETIRDSALAFNHSRGFGPALVERVQETLEVAVDGAFGPATVEALARWQAAHGLVVDGKLGPGTLAALEREWSEVEPGSLRKVYRIHPGVGVARLGDSPTEFFIAPEAPGVGPAVSSYRDQLGFIKRQAARFRVYETTLDQAGRTLAVRELRASEAEIRWTVHLVNRKAAGPSFPPAARGRRNASIEETELVIDPRPQELVGANACVRLDGSFLGAPVHLGELRTDGAGRLLVLGGRGVSRSPRGAPLEHYANNDCWHDDVGDGPVRAQLHLASGETVEAEPAWVVVAPPSYAPDIHHVVTWYDQAFHVATRLDPRLGIEAVSFTRDVYPILARTVLLQWVSMSARIGHGRGSAQEFTADEHIAALATKAPEQRERRRRVYEALTRPGGAGRGMPALSAGLDPEDPTQERPAMLTPTQLRVMEQWALGLFEADWSGAPPRPVPFAHLPAPEQPAALDRAALEAAIGGPFYPGIEASYLIARLDTYEAPFRVDRELTPGALTEGLALPWQADFQACQQRWWPAQRPTSVFRDDGREAHDWAEGVDMDDMVEAWARLGFVRKQGARYVEQERLGPEEPPEQPRDRARS